MYLPDSSSQFYKPWLSRVINENYIAHYVLLSLGYNLEFVLLENSLILFWSLTIGVFVSAIPRLPFCKSAKLTRPGMVAHACKLSNSGGWGRRIQIWGQPGQLNENPVSKNKKGWECGSKIKCPWVQSLVPK